MSLEAAAGKNPVTHVGKIYNVIAREIAECIVVELREIASAQCLMVSRIGAPVTRPSVVHVRLATRDGSPAQSFAIRVGEIAAAYLARVPDRIDAFVNGKIDIF